MKKLFLLALIFLFLNSCMMKDYITYEINMKANTGGEQLSIPTGNSVGSTLSIKLNKGLRGKGEYSVGFTNDAGSNFANDVFADITDGDGTRRTFVEHVRQYGLQFGNSSGNQVILLQNLPATIPNAAFGFYFKNRKGEQISNIMTISIVDGQIIVDLDPAFDDIEMKLLKYSYGYAEGDADPAKRILVTSNEIPALDKNNPPYLNGIKIGSTNTGVIGTGTPLVKANHPDGVTTGTLYCVRPASVSTGIVQLYLYIDDSSGAVKRISPFFTVTVTP